MEKKLGIVCAQGLFKLSPIFVDKELIDAHVVTMYFIGWF